MEFEQTKNRVILSGMPEECPDEVAKMAVLRMEFSEPPEQKLGPCCVDID